MKKITSLFCLFALMFSTFAPVFAQQRETDDSEVVKITTDLVQVDAVVTDKDGNPVTNLTAADFEVLQDGKAQKIIGLSYVDGQTPPRRAAQKSEKIDKNAPLAPSAKNLRPENAGRILTFIVDDGGCQASVVGMTAARQGIEKFVREQMRPDDLVAIFQTRGGSNMLQRYTADKNFLLERTKKIRWLPPKFNCLSAGDGSFYGPARSDSTLKSGQGTFNDARSNASQQALTNLANDRQVVGTVGVLSEVLNGLQRVPGRKSVFLLSDGLILSGTDGGYRGQALDAARALTDAATRASVVFNTISVRGVDSPDFIGADADLQANIDGVGESEIDPARNRQNSEARALENGLFYIANQTGGRFYRNSNNIDVPIGRSLNLEKGYYLLAYEPDDDTFKGKNFNKIEVKLKRPDLRVRSRSGFYGITDAELKPKPRTADSELYQAAKAALPGGGLNLKLTAYFANNPTTGSVVRSFIHLDGNELTFTDEPNNFKKAVFDVVAVTLNEKNEVVEDYNKTYTIKFPAAQLPSIQQNGLIYSTDVPLKKSGAYTFRVAVRDGGSKLIGSASQLIEAPDLTKNKLYLAELNLGKVVLQNDKPLPPTFPQSSNGFAPVDSATNPAIRRFERGSILFYNYVVYNAETEKSTNQPKLNVQVRLYRDGELITDGKPQPAQLEPQTDWKRIVDYGYFRLPADSLPGDYALQIIVRDLLGNETISQSVDFTVN